MVWLTLSLLPVIRDSSDTGHISPASQRNLSPPQQCPGRIAPAHFSCNRRSRDKAQRFRDELS